MDLRCSSCSITESVVFLICCFIVASAWDLVAQPLQMSSMGVGREGGEGGYHGLVQSNIEECLDCSGRRPRAIQQEEDERQPHHISFSYLSIAN